MRATGKESGVAELDKEAFCCWQMAIFLPVAVDITGLHKASLPSCNS